MFQFHRIFISVDCTKNFQWIEKSSKFRGKLSVPSYILLIGPHCLATSRSTSTICPSLVFTLILVSAMAISFAWINFLHLKILLKIEWKSTKREFENNRRKYWCSFFFFPGNFTIMTGLIGSSEGHFNSLILAISVEIKRITLPWVNFKTLNHQK